MLLNGLPQQDYFLSLDLLCLEGNTGTCTCIRAMSQLEALFLTYVILNLHYTLGLLVLVLRTVSILTA